MDGKKQPTRSRYGRTPRSPFWLVIRHRRGRMEVLLAELVASSRALPVFGFAEEAWMFVRLGLFGGAGWRAAKIGTG